MSSMASRPRSGKRRIRSPALRTKRSARRGILGRVPSAAEGFDQTNAGAHLEIHGLRQRELVGQERPLGVGDDEVVGQALSVLHLGEAKVALSWAGNPGGTAGGALSCSGFLATANEGAGCPHRIASACSRLARARSTSRCWANVACSCAWA